jgi:hypothetical protein
MIAKPFMKTKAASVRCKDKRKKKHTPVTNSLGLFSASVKHGGYDQEA